MRVEPIVIAFALVQSAAAMANPFDVVGLTSRRAAQANTGVASADDVSALYYNPAGMVLTVGPELSIGTIGAYARLEGSGKLPDPIGGQLAMKTSLPLRGAWADRIVIGIALHLLPRDVAHVIAPAPDEPFYPYYGDRMSRIVVLPGAAVRINPRWSVGVSIDVLANLGGALSASEGATRSIDVSGDQRIGTIARPIVGVSWQATRCLRLGAVVRQRFELPFETSAETTIAGEPLDLAVKAAGQFAPHQVVAGLAWTRGRSVVSFDARYARWSDYRGPYVRLDSTLPLVGEVPALAIAVPFEDTYGGRVGIERIGKTWIARGGYGFETSPVPEKQTGVTNLLDGPRHTFAGGVGRVWGRFRIDAHVSLQVVQGRTIEKVLDDGLGEYDPFTSLRDEDTMTNGLQISNPGFPNPLKAGGQVLSGGVTMEVRL